MKKKLAKFMGMVSIILALGACGKEKFTVDKIGITYVKAPLNVPSIVEKKKDIFQKEFREYKLPVEYSNLTAGPEQIQALASGDLQFLNGVGATSVILAGANGMDIKILSTYSSAPGAFVIFTNDENIKSPMDLKGKTVVGPKGTILHELLVAYLKKGGLSESDVKFLSMGIPESQSALIGKRADVALLAGPAAYNVEKEGFKVLTTGVGLIKPVIVTATSGKFAEENPELVNKFLEGQRESLRFINGHLEEALEMTSEETGLPMEAVEKMYKMYNFCPKITPEIKNSIRDTMKFLYENKMINEEIDINKLF